MQPTKSSEILVMKRALNRRQRPSGRIRLLKNDEQMGSQYVLPGAEWVVLT